MPRNSLLICLVLSVVPPPLPCVAPPSSSLWPSWATAGHLWSLLPWSHAITSSLPHWAFKSEDFGDDLIHFSVSFDSTFSFHSQEHLSFFWCRICRNQNPIGISLSIISSPLSLYNTMRAKVNGHWSHAYAMLWWGNSFCILIYVSGILSLRDNDSYFLFATLVFGLHMPSAKALIKP